MKQEKQVKKHGLIKRMALTGQLTRFTIYLSATIPAILFVILALLSFAGIINPIRFNNPMSDSVTPFGTGADFLILAFLIAFGTYGIFALFHL